MTSTYEEPRRPRDVQELLLVLAAAAVVCIGAAIAGVVELARRTRR